ncbi:MAG: DUF3501 family protein [Pseudomonadales bacterium]|nr:DUF3501 family protein [Gammaproteobacteria bacterium]NNL57215.1 DUF3501 family protein [Pseudomonadales bacterium]
MATITRDSLLTLEDYAKARDEIRRAAIAQKNKRKVFVGDNVLLQFEDEQTIRYQIQEMLHAEKTFDQQGIIDELEAYNPLVPDGRNWKATQMIEFPDVEQRKQKLVELRGIERHTYVQVGDGERVYAIADEDMPRETEEKTSAIHFMRFELSDAMIAAAKAGEPIAVGIDHPAYRVHIDEIAPQTQASLVEDLR